MNPNLIAIIINNEEHPLNRQHLMEISPVIKKYVDDNPYKSDFFRIENTIPKEDIPKFIKLLKYNDTEITHSTIPLIHFLKKELGISIFDEKIDELTKKLNSVFDRDDCILRIYEEYEMMVYQLSFDLLVHEINPENSIFFAKLFYTYGYTYPSMFIQKCLPFILSIDSENENIKLLENIKIFQKKKPFFNKAHSLMEKKKGSEIYPLLDFHQKIEKWIYKKNEAKAKTKFESYDYIMTIKNDDIDTLQSLTSNSSLSLNHNFLKSQNAFFQSFILSLIEVAAYFSSIKCFKFLLSNHVDLRDSLFFFAIAGGNPEIIHLCEQHLSFFDYNLSLEIAIIFHHYELISWLIESKNTQFTLENALLCLKYSTFSTVSNHYVNSSLFNIDEFLLLAINSSLTDLAKWILSLDSIDVNYQSQKFSNPLLSACLTNNVAIVECLLTFESIDVNTKIKVHDQSPLHIACKNNYIEIARLLLNHPKIIRNTRDFGKNRKTPLHMAAESGNLEIVKLLLEYDDVEIDASTYDQETPLYFAATNYHKEVFSYLVDKNASLSLRLSNIGNHILHIVCKNGWNDMLLKIIDILSAKSNLSLNITNSKQESLLHFAAYSNSLDVVETILHSKYFRKSKYDQDNNTNNLNAAHYACKRKNNNSDILKLLYTNGINFDQLTKNGKNILHYACKSCNKDQIEYILSIRENMVFTKDGNGKTPLEYDKDGNILMDDKMKSKPFLHDAVKKRNLSFAQYLIKNGFSGNNRDINGNTPIMELCKSCLGCGYTNILNFLLPISDLSLKNNDKSIIEMCADAKNYSALEPILQYEQNNDILDVNQINNIIQSYSDNPQLITILTKFLP